VIRLYHVSKVYPPRFTALSDVSLAIEPGEFVFLTGPSGAGKTTLLRLLLGAETPTVGQVVIGGRNLVRLGRRGIAKLRRSTGMVFQDAAAPAPGARQRRIARRGGGRIIEGGAARHRAAP
jgi:cell division transport system ATP-binding protein